MKKKRVWISAFVLCLILFFLLLSGRGTALEIYGLENYRAGTCSVGLTRYLFPSDSFLTDFPYTKGDYHYNDSGDMGWGYVTVFASLEYSPEEYELVKQYCLDSFTFCPDHEESCNGYTFLQTLGNADTEDPSHLECKFPEKLNYFAFCDEENTLYFLGYYNGCSSGLERKLLRVNFPGFLESAFSGDYDFSK